MARNVVFEGTSITVGPWYSSYIANVTLVGDTYTSFAFSGSSITGNSVTHSITFSNGSTARKDRVMAAYVPGTLNLLVLEAGANDYYIDTDTAGNLALLETLFLYCDDMRTLGYKVILNTQLPQDAGLSIGAAHNRSRLYIDPVVRAAVGNRIDACIDWAADSRIGPDSAALGANTADTAYFQDYVHLTAEGTAQASFVARAVINSFETLSTQRFALTAGITADELVATIL